MANVFLGIFLLTPILTFVSLINPNLLIRLLKRNVTRKAIILTGVFTFISSFVGIGTTYKGSSQINNESKPEVQLQVSPTTTQQNVSSFTIQETDVTIKRVVDGDTVETESGLKVRYIGIDTPETVDPSRPVQCFGEEASKKNRELVEGKDVRLEKDISETDKYGRLLRYVWINDSLINEILVREGYAKSSSYPPDVKYQERFREAEKIAREQKLGLWGDVCITPTPTTKPTPTLRPTATPKPYTPTVFVPTVYVPYVPANPTTPPSSGSGSGSYTCDCSKTCPNISSCAEAQYLLNTCGCKERDGDSDGIACDSAPLHCQN